LRRCGDPNQPRFLGKVFQNRLVIEVSIPTRIFVSAQLHL
jgi:hypothetical protein